MYTGRCLCGSVQFEIHAPIQNIVYCHCSKCRKAQGSAFATNGNVASHAFRFTKGEDQLTGYKSSPTQTKYFCRHCGSPVISKKSDTPSVVRIRLGTIESPINEQPEAHIFTGSKADWDIICDDLPQFKDAQPD